MLRNEPVSFKDFQVDDKEIDVGTPDDLKSMKKDLPEMIQDISDALPIKKYISEIFDSEIVVSKNLDRVTEFFTMVSQILQDNDVNIALNDSESEDDN